MAVSTLTGAPATIEAGNTIIFTESLAGYPVAAWTMAFVLSLNGKSTTFAATTSGNLFLITITAAQSAILTPGHYDYAEYVTETATGQRTTAVTGTLEVVADLTQVGIQSFASTMLASLEAAILKLSTGTNASVSFNGQSFAKKDMKALTDQRAYYKGEVIREQQKADAARGAPSKNRIITQFASAGSINPPYGNFLK